jgi:hypothetical protein
MKLRSTAAVLSRFPATPPLNLGPAWLPIAIVLSALPCTWLGGALHRSAQGAPR